MSKQSPAQTQTRAQTQTLEQWRARREAHRARLSPFVEAHRARRSRGEKHAVWDFLWEYYSFKPAQLLKWSPGFGVELQASEARASDCRASDARARGFQASDCADFAGRAWAPTPGGIALDAGQFPLHRLDSAREILKLLRATAAREPFHGCFGLHEWAMVYRAPQTRHASPLRLSDAAIATLVETQTVRCSHFDAFRFFAPSARPLNVLQPAFENRANFEQPGCIHASMDLYKWAYKFAPWISSDLVAEGFELARDARHLDMRAAPYDLSAYDIEPIAIETAPGRAQYALAQRAIADRAAPLRARLIAAYRELVEAIEGASLCRFTP